MSTKHTPGPWHVVLGINQMADFGTTVHHRGRYGVYSDADTHGDDEADAHLIGAALEMLNGLLAFKEFADARRRELGLLSSEMEVVYTTVCAAIAKATGNAAHPEAKEGNHG